MKRSTTRRHRLSSFRATQNIAMLMASAACALCALIPLVWIVGYVIVRGAHAWSFAFFTELPHPPGELGGGVANSIVGSAILIACACVVSLPIGIGGGVYLAEFSKSRGGHVIRFATDLLSSTPSIVIGLFAYILCVVPTHHFSGLAGSFGLSLIMIPIMVRTTESMLRAVPHAIRESAIALGIPTWRVLLRVVVPTARSGIITGVLLAIARIAGETAPLLFTALGNQFWSFNPKNTMASLPMQIFTYAISPYESWQAQAWGATLLLVVSVLGLHIVARMLVRQRTQRAQPPRITEKSTSRSHT